MLVSATEGLVPPSWDEIGLEAAGGADAEKYPYLARSLKNAIPAHSTTVEWLVDGPVGPKTWFNFTQIVRTPFAESFAASDGHTWAKAKSKYMVEHLRSIEQTLDRGYLSRTISWHFDEEFGEWYPVETKTMGGARFYLRRQPNEKDFLSIRPLRDTVYMDRTAPDMDGRSGEFLTELSLVVIPAEEAT